LEGDSIVINVQGDEPMIKPEMIEQLVKLMKEGYNVDKTSQLIGTLVTKIDDEKFLKILIL